MDKKSLTEIDICTKFITPTILADFAKQQSNIRELRNQLKNILGDALERK